MKGTLWISRKLNKKNLHVLHEIYTCIYIFMNNFHVIVNIHVRIFIVYTVHVQYNIKYFFTPNVHVGYIKNTVAVEFLHGIHACTYI